MGLEEEILPHRSSIEENAIEEERRLAYVGITRARQTLTMTMAARRKLFGEIAETTPSRFIDELPQEDLEKEGMGQPSDPEGARQKGLDSLDALKGLFA